MNKYIDTEETKRFEQAVDTRLLCAALRSVPAGETVTYTKLSEVVGQHKIGGDYSYLQAALRIVERELETVFKCVPKVGYRRLTDSQIVNEVPTGFLDHLRRTSNRVLRRVGYAKDEMLSNSERCSRNTAMAFAGAMAHATKAKPQQALESRVRASSHSLPIAETLEYLKGV